jgi:hypothetical protein
VPGAERLHDPALVQGGGEQVDGWLRDFLALP